MNMENDIRYEIAIWLTGQNPRIHQQRESLANAYPFLSPALTKPSNKIADAAMMEAIHRRERPDEMLPELLGISRAAASVLRDAESCRRAGAAMGSVAWADGDSKMHGPDRSATRTEPQGSITRSAAGLR
jgi:hypothetical protein